ncbi:hypothetical protein INR49_018259 [Caranx melampygus]|nr:hypothetical protein INR49_018259 [Caranx melampygus]
MADETLFHFIHNELIQYITKSSENGETDNGRNITKLENIGFRVGQGLIERLTKNTARFKDELDIMKFICKDCWTCVFKKQIDNLRTNHQGIYVLQDNKFRLLSQLSAVSGLHLWSGERSSGQPRSKKHCDRRGVHHACM